MVTSAVAIDDKELAFYVGPRDEGRRKVRTEAESDDHGAPIHGKNATDFYPRK